MSINPKVVSMEAMLDMLDAVLRAALEAAIEEDDERMEAMLDMLDAKELELIANGVALLPAVERMTDFARRLAKAKRDHDRA